MRIRESKSEYKKVPTIMRQNRIDSIIRNKVKIITTSQTSKFQKSYKINTLHI